MNPAVFPLVMRNLVACLALALAMSLTSPACRSTPKAWNPEPGWKYMWFKPHYTQEDLRRFGDPSDERLGALFRQGWGYDVRLYGSGVTGAHYPMYQLRRKLER